MMTLMAEELRASFVHSSTSPTAASTAQVPTLPPPVIDIGITKEPYFTDKAKSIDASGMYGTEIEQIHLTGFDTLIRIFTPKYYPDHDPPLSALAPFLTRHRIRATVRVDKDTTSANLKDTTTDGLDTVDGQKAYLEMIADGGLEHDGLQRAWASKVELVVDDTGEAAGVSSTRIRDAARHGRWDEVQGLVGEGVQAWIRERGLYRD
jgi:nicotinamide-nucleotide adenylyltransferase